MIYANAEDRQIARFLEFDLHAARYPETYDVSRQVYESVERVVLDWIAKHRVDPFEDNTLKLGPHGGLMFKNVELIIS